MRRRRWWGKRTPDPQTRDPWREGTGQKSVFVLPKQTSGPWPPMDLRERRGRVRSLCINILRFSNRYFAGFFLLCQQDALSATTHLTILLSQEPPVDSQQREVAHVLDVMNNSSTCLFKQAHALPPHR